MNTYDSPQQPPDDDERETPFGGLEEDTVTPQEYNRAIETLREVLAINPNEIQTIEDLSAHISLVGAEIRKVILASGHIQTTNFEYKKPWESEEAKAVDRTWIIRKPVGDHTICAVSKYTGSVIEAYKIIEGNQLSDFNIRVPATGDIGVVDDSFSNLLSIFAVDWRSGKAQSYYPAKEPFNAQVQQDFLRVLQDGIRDILAVIDKPEI